MWRMFKKGIPIGEFWSRIGQSEDSLCCSCDLRVNETYQHFFLTCQVAKHVLEAFVGGPGTQGPFYFLK